MYDVAKVGCIIFKVCLRVYRFIAFKYQCISMHIDICMQIYLAYVCYVFMHFVFVIICFLHADSEYKRKNSRNNLKIVKNMNLIFQRGKLYRAGLARSLFFRYVIDQTLFFAL